MHIAILAMACDFKEKTALGPTPMSTSSWMFCPGCDFNKTAKDAHKPFSFLTPTCSGQNSRWKLRTTQSILTALDYAFDRIKKPSKRKTYLRRCGLRPNLKSVKQQTLGLQSLGTLPPLKSLLPSSAQKYYPTHPRFIKGFNNDSLTDDGLHLEADGLLQCIRRSYNSCNSYTSRYSQLVEYLSSSPPLLLSSPSSII